ncbi:DUF4440 domain-containing protein [Paraliobacillus sediminis]|uniref:nuclear transport factor 2 family protein n=1 Tax=Paraliobacillus sediminis TaxID=1885916 RepID=UPI000E3C9574|nr:DUF4440 domain-containing protein [Paraliobacillus sediminis]
MLKYICKCFENIEGTWNTDKLKAQLKALEKSHLSQDVRKDVKKLDEILETDFIEIVSSGFMFYKEDCLTSGVELFDMSLHNYEVQILAPDVVLATYFIEDKTRSRNTLRSSIWKLIYKIRKLYFHQGTITEQKFLNE